MLLTLHLCAWCYPCVALQALKGLTSRLHEIREYLAAVLEGGCWHSVLRGLPAACIPMAPARPGALWQTCGLP